jgi:hypothetical protein
MGRVVKQLDARPIFSAPIKPMRAGRIGTRLFVSTFRARELRPPLLGFVRFGPGFVELDEAVQRVDGVAVFGPELGFATVEGLQQWPFWPSARPATRRVFASESRLHQRIVLTSIWTATPEHAGMQYRAHNDVAGMGEGQSWLTRPYYALSGPNLRGPAL